LKKKISQSTEESKVATKGNPDAELELLDSKLRKNDSSVKSSSKEETTDNPTVEKGLYRTYKKVSELFDIITTLILLFQVYYIGMKTSEASIKNQYRIVFLILFVCTFAPIWIAHSALLKIMQMNSLYEEVNVAKNGSFKNTILLILLTFIGPIILIIARIIQAIGEVVAILTYVTFTQRFVAKVRAYFDRMCTFVLVGID
jgi:hypothetical protein